MRSRPPSPGPRQLALPATVRIQMRLPGGSDGDEVDVDPGSFG
jgi:hypothetical protein